MEAKDSAMDKRWTTTVLLVILYLLFLLFIGLATPIFADVFYAFPSSLHWNGRLIALIHWKWTVPLGVLVSGMLLWKQKVLSRRACWLIDMSLFILFWVALGFWIWLVNSPIYYRSPIIGWPVGSLD